MRNKGVHAQLRAFLYPFELNIFIELPSVSTTRTNDPDRLGSDKVLSRTLKSDFLF